MLRQEPLWLNRPIRSNGFAWRITCCGIFCNSQKEGETESKIPHHTSPQQRISGVRHVCFFEVSGSGCYASVHRLSKPERAAALAELIAQQRERSYRTCGYRRMWLWLKRQNIFRICCCKKDLAEEFGLICVELIACFHNSPFLFVAYREYSYGY